jgi:hypothetical protein
MDTHWPPNPGYSASVAAKATPTHYKLVASKSFHGDNLILQLCYDTLMDIYDIHIIRVNCQELHSLWGMWTGDDEAGALRKFNSIVL